MATRRFELDYGTTAADIHYTVRDLDETVLVARTVLPNDASGKEYPAGSGLYFVEVPSWDAAWVGVIYWDDGGTYIGKESFIAGTTSTSLSPEDIAAIAAAIASTVNVNIIAPATGSTLDLTKGDSWASGITITKTAAETHWPTTLSTVHFWAEPTDGLLTDDTSALGMPRIITASALTSVSTTATITLPANHGLTTGVHAIRGATQPEYNGYYTVTISSNTGTFTFAGSSTATATGTIKIQPAIACTVTQATGSSQAFSFAPTAAQLQLPSAARADGYRFSFVANAVTAPRALRGGPMNTRPSPTG